ncbi:hypothetical protein ciss_03200 [Carboxydothermus islandicus]|uniref:Uncharacterized protein n=1 Tax=Carboxydothermus islandicus TaxID=661089 RepID=A0A1L8CZS3_9THEO|nr:hypothetical protein [Carboxydothermus islandicus]GAV24387.1 hypothetical protein ciss_03200 [Carboxydothermus islandicus]
MEYKKTVSKLMKVVIIFFLSLFICIVLNSIIVIIIEKPINDYILFMFYATFPYYLSAIFLKRTKTIFSNVEILIYALIFNSFEKLLWLYLGYLIYLGSPDGKLINENLLTFIRRELFSFYSYEYIFGGSILSILTFVVAIRKK